MRERVAFHCSSGAPSRSRSTCHRSAGSESSSHVSSCVSMRRSSCLHRG
ncbi:hypothetical protein ACFPRL_19455 [Pseudoclavibacter helvolus]